MQFHSHAYRNPRDPVDLVGKRVVVAGLGNSAVDIAAELGSRAVAERVCLAVRRGAWILPKWFMGTPITRLPQPQNLFPWMPWQVTSVIMGAVMRLQFGRPQDYGLPRPASPAVAVASDRQPGPPVWRIGHGDIAVKPPVREFRGPRVVFEDGSEEVADAIIWCTATA